MSLVIYKLKLMEIKLVQATNSGCYLTTSVASSTYQPLGNYILNNDINKYLSISSSIILYQPLGNNVVGNDNNKYLAIYFHLV